MRDSNVANAAKESTQRVFSHGLHGSRSPRGSQGKAPQKPSQRCSRCSAVSIYSNCEDQSLSSNDTAFAQHGLAQDHARYDDLVLRRLCLMAKRRHRKRQWTLTSMAGPRHLDIDRTSDQDIQEIVPHDEPHHLVNASGSRRHSKP